MTTSQKLLAGFWLGGGINHFVNPKPYVAIMPDYVPAHEEMVRASGLAEIAAGAAVLHPDTRKTVGRWLILATLAAVYPANVHMALHPERFKKIPRWLLWARLPLQSAFGWWAWKATED